MASLLIRRVGGAAKRFFPLLFSKRFRGGDTLSIICMMRNEAPYLKEWIEYHRLVGVDRFYIFDNESTDGARGILRPYIDAGVVVYEYLTDARIAGLGGRYKDVGEKAQIGHWLGIEKCRDRTKWAAMIDVDEFLAPKKDASIPKFLARFGRRVQQVIIGWNIYGSNGLDKKPAGLVIESYTRRGAGRSGLDEINNFKSVVNPRRILVDCNHHHIILGKTVDENGRSVMMFRDKGRVFPTELCAVNHYIVKSREECMRKIMKNKNIHFNRYDGAYFKKYDANDVEDLTMRRFAAKVKAAMG